MRAFNVKLQRGGCIKVDKAMQDLLIRTALENSLLHNEELGSITQELMQHLLWKMTPASDSEEQW